MAIVRRSGGDKSKERAGRNSGGDFERGEGGNEGETSERFGRTDPDAPKEGEDRPPEANIGNVSGLGGRRDVTGLSIQQRRKARGASLINLVPTLAETTRRALFGL